MTAFLIFFACILSIILFILFAKISLKFEYDSQQENSFKLRIYLYNEKIGMNLLKNKNKHKENHKKETNKEETKKEDDKKRNAFERLYNLYTELKKVKYVYYYSQDFIRKRLIVKNLNVNIGFGMSDAAKTGIATGAVWGLLYNMFALITKIFTVLNHKFNVEPDYNNEKFLFDANGILTFRLANIISIAFYILIKYITVSKNEEEKLEEGI